ncbi:major tail protein [Clostridium beijerinckii]|uniref:major tail protein n=1 Tax=Clostridium beijerinckii TaxID=1520 RepID=UPI00098BD5A9|nr:major tail protein [Clostridium beijerinckii]MBA8936494.1 phi13 family phage major tail protein [Clostridium beijerinckii]NRU41038.1 phi13 family phage major tail protein [Clostridium beijerinckii]NSA95687.1 phi13 family phage major tail protein [Clostridium beijerinckii]OOM63405.1 phage major tail protein [Clostridium beijerinckii]OOM70564.1 phage major tail protein [Clostridium beijerinckii]
MAIVGLEKLYYSKITKDDSTGITFDKPIYLPGIKEIKIAPKSNTAKLYAENKVWDQTTTLEDIEVTVNVADLTNAQSADLLGQTIATEGGTFASSDDIAPYIALLYVANKSNGKKRYGILYKGKMELPDDSSKGQEGKVDYQTPEMKATFQPLQNNGMWKYNVDEDDPNCPSDIETKFFESVIVPTKKVATPTT